VGVYLGERKEARLGVKVKVEEKEREKGLAHRPEGGKNSRMPEIMSTSLRGW